LGLEKPIHISVDKLKAKLQKKYPNHNFDVSSMPDTTCRMRGKCPASKPMFYDNDGNYFCAVYVDVVKDLNSMKKERTECGAYLVDVSIRMAERKRKDNVQPLN